MPGRRWPYRNQRAAWGFLPNYAAAFSTRPDVARAWNALNTTVRDGMDRRRFEIATIAAARALRSTYCTAAHSKFLRDVCGDEAAMMSIAEQPSGAALDARDRAVYEFAGKVAVDAASIQQQDVDRLREVGPSDADVADVVFAASARSLLHRRPGRPQNTAGRRDRADVRACPARVDGRRAPRRHRLTELHREGQMWMATLPRTRPAARSRRAVGTSLSP